MKNLKIYISAFALLAVASSCKKSFLDEQPNQTVSTVQEQNEVKQDPKLLDARISGLYTTMYETGTGGTTNHDDFGQKGYDIFSDMISGDLALGALNYGWYSGVERYTATKDNGGNPDYEPYRYYYRVIYAANTVIDILGGNDAALPNADVKHYMGQAKAMRAYGYFYLANLYSNKGYGTGNEKILPIVTSATQVNLPMSTSGQVYTQIVKDLNQSIILLGDYTRPDKGHIDRTVAQGLLAYALAARGTNTDLSRVLTLTDSVLAKYPLTTNSQVVGNFDFTTRQHQGDVLNPESGFNSLSTPSWIWGADITLSSGLDLVSWWGQMDIYTYSYAWAGDPKFIDEDLFNSINAVDVRKGQFFNNVGPFNDDHNDYGGLVPQGKFFDAARIEGGQRNVTDDYIYMRADEMQILNAEAQSRLGNDPAARTSILKLTGLRTNGADVYGINGLSGAALREAIYQQSRIELWGEGKTYLAMKRNQHSIKKGGNHLFTEQIGVTYTYDAPELTFVTPSAEFLYNPNLTK